MQIGVNQVDLLQVRGFFITSHVVRCQLAAMPNDLHCMRLIHGCSRAVCRGETALGCRAVGAWICSTLSARTQSLRL